MEILPRRQDRRVRTGLAFLPIGVKELMSVPDMMLFFDAPPAT